ncbi:MAG: cytochrome c oxidase subunit 3 [Acidobacteriota bacterium]|nr:cytochrome c oxidase subunit 3 [Acidobacteriota bacterium]
MFFDFYFITTGLRTVHMIVGIGLLLATLRRNLMGQFSAIYYTPVELAGLYLHFFDIIWVFLYAIFYITGLHR